MPVFEEDRLGPFRVPFMDLFVLFPKTDTRKN